LLVLHLVWRNLTDFWWYGFPPAAPQILGPWNIADIAGICLALHGGIGLKQMSNFTCAAMGYEPEKPGLSPWMF
jgi:hypothetical protein